MLERRPVLFAHVAEKGPQLFLHSGRVGYDCPVGELAKDVTEDTLTALLLHGLISEKREHGS